MQPKRLILDRCEEEKAIFETEEKEIVVLDKSLLPQDAEEGAVFIFQNGILRFDLETTRSRKEIVEQKLAKLFKRHE